MATDYSAASFNFQDCLDRLHPGDRIPPIGEPNPCVPWPSAFNPYHITNLSQFRVHMLQDILANPYFGQNLNLCYLMADILPNTFIEINNVTHEPQRLNAPIIALQNLAQRTLPYPLNKTTDPGDMAVWWWSMVTNDTQAARDFIDSTKDSCTFAICNSIGGIGDQDITGIGMLTSTAMLIVLAVMFSTPAVFGWTEHRSLHHHHKHETPRTEKHLSKGDRVRSSLVGTLDDLLAAVIIFTLSVLIAAIIYRAKTDDLLYDIFMAEVLSLISSSAMVMIAASYWQNNRLRPAMLIGFAVNAILTITLFGIEFHRQVTDTNTGGYPLEKNCLGADLKNLGNKKVNMPVCFTLWALALFGSLVHIPWVRARAPGKGDRGLGSWIYRGLGLLPPTLGFAAILWLCVIFYNTYKDMKNAFGDGFTSNEKDWGFGQFLALATWVPPILTFMHLLTVGMKDALTSRLPVSWVAVLAKPTHDDQKATERQKPAA